MPSEPQLPVIDISSLVAGDPANATAEAIGRACRDEGFFYVVGHDIDDAMQQELERLSRRFFGMDLAEKMAICMQLGGRAWRGYFPVGDELTSGVPDAKEGLYFGTELDLDDPRVAAGMALHGANLFPRIPGFREVVLEYLDQLTQLGHRLMRGLALSLDLDASFFEQRYTRDPTVLFRIFYYPPAATTNPSEWGVGEHTDYGLLTILRQDAQGGLQVKSKSAWIEAPPIPNSFVCNIGDMLDRMTGGLYRSTPHRVQRPAEAGRLSFPFFFDPSFDAEVRPIFPKQPISERWDGTDLQQLTGTYGEYLLSKVIKVFPALRDELE